MDATMKKLIYSFLSTRPGMAIRRRAESYLKAHPYYRTIDGIKLKYASVTDVDCNRTAIRHGLGYNSKWVLEKPVNTLCDLGCNTGLFTLWLMAKTGVRPSGIAVDANPEMCARAEEHFAMNGLMGMKVINGLVGESDPTFHIHSVGVSSSTVSDPRAFGALVKTIKVNRINVYDTLRFFGGGCRVNLLKVDIEGSEFELFRMEEGKLSSICDRILVEWHEPKCNLVHLRSMLPRHRLVDFQCYGSIGYAGFEKL